MNIIFMGTPDFAVPTLKKFLQADMKPVLVVSQPDKPRGRKLVLEHTAVKKIAIEHGLHIYQPEDINHPESIAYLKTFLPDIIVTVAYGSFLNKELRTMCPLGAINMHPSLLPLHRGADPVRNALLCGDIETGISIFFISGKMDAGRIIAQKKYKIDQLVEKINYTNLENKLAHLGADLTIEAISILVETRLALSEKSPQPPLQRGVDKELKQKFKTQEGIASYSQKVTNASNIADFSLDAVSFINRVRAYAYEPGYFCYFRGKRLKILEAEIVCSAKNTEYPMIKYVAKDLGFVISLKDADILIREVQYEGKKMMNAWAFHLGARLVAGERLCSNPPSLRGIGGS